MMPLVILELKRRRRLEQCWEVWFDAQNEGLLRAWAAPVVVFGPMKQVIQQI
jgi:hypothetical protein